MLLWLGFIICTAAIIYSGIKLSKYGDVIAEKTGLGRAWIGLILMASVTSLPELVTGISSVTSAGVPDIAVGDVLGSCVFNMLIIALLDAVYRIMPISAKAHQGNILSAAFGILLLGTVSVSIFLGNQIASLGWIGPYSIFFIIIYLIAMRLVYFYEKKQIAALMKEKAALLADHQVVIQAPSLTTSPGGSGFRSVQPMGALFEQSLLVLCDSIILRLMAQLGVSAAQMQERHANLE